MHCTSPRSPLLAITPAGLALLLGMATGGANAATTLTATVRDFCFEPISDRCSAHPDFEGTIARESGIVDTRLGADGKPVYALGDGDGSRTTSGATRFDQWYRNTPGVNSTTTVELVNSSTDPGQILIVEPEFFPIDDALFGNQGLNHNFHFTMELRTRFEFGGDETFTFSGDDDLWVFVNGSLALDLGGVHGRLTGTIDLSDETTRALLDITPGETYDLDLFFAERHTNASYFQIDTTIDLQPVPVPAAGLLLLSAMGWLGLRRRQA